MSSFYIQISASTLTGNFDVLPNAHCLTFTKPYLQEIEHKNDSQTLFKFHKSGSVSIRGKYQVLRNEHLYHLKNTNNRQLNNFYIIIFLIVGRFEMVNLAALEYEKDAFLYYLDKCINSSNLALSCQLY